MKKSRNFIANLFDVNSAALDSKGRFSCGANPLADLCLVSLWKDVDVGLEGAGFNHSFVSGGHRQNPAEDREQLLTLASGKLQAVLTEADQQRWFSEGLSLFFNIQVFMTNFVHLKGNDFEHSKLKPCRGVQVV